MLSYLNKNVALISIMVIIGIIAMLLPVQKDTTKDMRTKIDDIANRVDLVEFNTTQIKRNVDTTINHTANLSHRLSEDFYVKLNSYDSKLKSVQDTIDYTLNRLAVIDESMSDIDGVESFNSFVTTLNLLSHEIVLLKTELNSIKTSINSLDTRLKALEK